MRFRHCWYCTWSTNGGGNGLLSGLFGRIGTRLGAGAELQYVSELQAKVQGLEAEKVANANLVSAFNQTVRNDKELRGEMYAYIRTSNSNRNIRNGSSSWN